MTAPQKTDWTAAMIAKTMARMCGRGTLGHAPHQAYFPGIESGAKGTMDISRRVFWDNAAMDEILNFADFPMQAAILKPMEG